MTFGKTVAEAVTTIDLSNRACKVIAFPHASPRNQMTIRQHYPTRQAFEDAISHTFCDLIAHLERRSPDA